MAHSESGKDEYFPYFDYLRIILASVVMLAHDKVITWPNSGKLAVDIFFALSGWLIGGILLNTRREDLPRFYFNRAVRIWIPYYIALILLVIASLLKDPINAKWLEFIFYKLTWVYNLFGTPQLQDCRNCMPLDGTGHHFWSVNAEEQFYLLAPILLVLLHKFGRMPIIWIAISFSAWMLWIYAPISLGVLAAVLAQRYGNFYTSTGVRALLASLVVASGYGLIFDTHYEVFAPVFSICLVLLLAVRGQKTLIGSFLGGISYPLYLNHWIGVFFFNFVLGPFGLRDSALRPVLSVVINFCIAGFLYWYIERRALLLRGAMYTPDRGMRIAICAYGMVLTGLIFGTALRYNF